jgi:hypothetical protein
MRIARLLQQTWDACDPTARLFRGALLTLSSLHAASTTKGGVNYFFPHLEAQDREQRLHEAMAMASDPSPTPTPTPTPTPNPNPNPNPRKTERQKEQRLHEAMAMARIDSVVLTP